jgi:hypothetical protein
VITDYHLRVMKKPKLINLSEQRKWETRLKFPQRVSVLHSGTIRKQNVYREC